ncbi:DUF6920 family protein [Psychroserpens mesophilus]|uniref:DUF6920 family protein n=1 Tax=Psychroserpens mesophilus TaxID=325473 RepID=UPI003D6594A3
MRYVFAIILGIHGLIHLLGFVSAFFSTSIEKQLLSISKPVGTLWLIAFLLFIISGVQFLTYKKWFYLAFAAIVLSQVLIIIAWKDAKYGTIINVIILLTSISAYSTHRFNNMVASESKQLLQNFRINEPAVITEKDIEQLPEIVQKWMINSGVIGKEKIRFARLKQIGNMRIKPDGTWMPFTATQYIDVEKSAFVWSTSVNAMPIVSLLGRDKLMNGEGGMLITLAGVIPVVNASKNKKINQGAMLRCLAEICWYPSAAINNHMSWEYIDNRSAKATLTIDDQIVSGVFTFSEKGQIQTFEANRYYGGETSSELEKWVVENRAYKDFNGIIIPSKSDVIWKLSDGDFNWLHLEITDIVYNSKQRY